MVEQQGEMLNNIEKNVEDAREYVAQAERELVETKEIVDKTRKVILHRFFPIYFKSYLQTYVYSLFKRLMSRNFPHVKFRDFKCSHFQRKFICAIVISAIILIIVVVIAVTIKLQS